MVIICPFYFKNNFRRASMRPCAVWIYNTLLFSRFIGTAPGNLLRSNHFCVFQKKTAYACIHLEVYAFNPAAAVLLSIAHGWLKDKNSLIHEYHYELVKKILHHNNLN